MNAEKITDGFYLECEEMLLEMMIYNCLKLCANQTIVFMAVFATKNLLCLFITIYLFIS